MKAVQFTPKFKGQVQRIEKSRIVVGCLESADLRLTGPGIAPIHAVIEVEERGTETVAQIFSLESSTGVWINGKKLPSHVLSSGDRIQIGIYEFSFDWFSSAFAAPRVSAPRANQKLQSIEVVLSWHGSILDIQHFPMGRRVSVGPKRSCDFAIPALLDESEFVLVGPSKLGVRDGFTVKTAPQMKGVVYTQGGVFDINSGAPLRRDAIAESGTLDLSISDFVRIGLGELEFFISASPRPPIVDQRFVLNQDPFFQRVFASSVLFTALVISGLLSVNVEKTLELEDVSNRIATILYQPEKYTSKISQVSTSSFSSGGTSSTGKVGKEDAGAPNGSKQSRFKKVVLKKQPPTSVRTGPGEPKQGAGAKAKGPSGTRGAPQQEAPEKLNMDLLTGASARIQNLLGGSATQLGKRTEKLKNLGGFEGPGSGGLAFSGNAQGGGGKALSYGGSAASGQGAGRVGTGLDAEGTGANLIGGQARVSVRQGGPEETVVMGAIDAAAVEAALQKHRDEFRLCYEREINAGKPLLFGNVNTNFTIGPRGRVSEAGVSASTLENPRVERCVLQVIKRIQFPIPLGGGVVQVNYPFKFGVSGK